MPPLVKAPITVNFAQGLDTKTDPYQLTVGKFLSLDNAIFQKGGLLQKRNGFDQLTALPDTTSTSITTFNGNLTAIGPSLEAYSRPSATWVNKGQLHPLSLSTLPLIRNSVNQSQADSAVASNGLVCTAYTETDGTTISIKYAIADSVTGQNITAPRVIPTTSGTPTGSPRVFLLGQYFVIVFTNVITATPFLQYIAISITTPTNVTANTTISATYTPASTVSWDGYVANNSLYIAWNGSDIGGAIRIAALNSHLALSTAKVFATRVATVMSVTADLTQPIPVIYATFYNAGDSTGYILAVDGALNTVLAPTQWLAAGSCLNIATVATNMVCSIFYEVANTYSYNGVATNFIRTRTCTQAGALSSVSIVARSVGLASKAFFIDSAIYFLTAYQSPYQPTYFLMNSTGKIVSKLAYSNGGGYDILGLPSVTVNNETAQMAYLFKDAITPVNKNTNVPSGTQVNGIYAQLGINLATFTLNTVQTVTSEIAQNLFLSGGFLWEYDGYVPVENNFFVWPDNIVTSTSAAGGGINAATYFYVATYEWSDNQGNLYRSAPSVPVQQITTGGNSTNTINVPTLRLTYKIANPPKLVVYRWSVAQPIYYQTTSITSPILNDPTVDSIAIVDANSDATILGNSILYTNGGVIENISPPATTTMTLFDDRLFLLDAEDGTVWFSKQVIPTTPVEMSDLLTIYVAPTIGAAGSTGITQCLFPMDDKLIFFKKDAIYYITGTGPDNTGSNNQYSQPIFITSTVGCANQESIVFMPGGLMFQSDKGIWLLGRDLSTTYIGAPVEKYNSSTVKSAVLIPATNQVRFTLDSGITLMYDYYYGQWGTFSNVPGVSSTLYESLHTFLDKYGRVFQESPGKFVDGGLPVLLSFTTNWMNLAGLQGYERFYQMFLLGTYYTPFTLSVQFAYDYSGSPSQTVTVSPDNYSPVYGGLPLWGSGGLYGGPSKVFEARCFPQNQKCESFQVTVKEVYDSTLGVAPGAGLTLSGLTLLVGNKKGTRAQKASQSFG